MRTFFEVVLNFVLNWAMTPEGTVVILGWISAAGYLVTRLIRVRAEKKGAAAVKVLDYAERAVQEVYSEVVSAMKAASKDGKITPEEIKQAQTAALSRTIEIARRDGVDAVREVGHEALPRIIETAVGRVKERALPASLAHILGVFK